VKGSVGFIPALKREAFSSILRNLESEPERDPSSLTSDSTTVTNVVAQLSREGFHPAPLRRSFLPAEIHLP
jgi:hypothetical protein